MKVLVIDIGGSNAKLRATGQTARTKLPTGPACTPDHLLADLAAATAGWDYDAVTIGFPAPVVDGRLPFEPTNLGPGWVDFRFDLALGKPVKLLNDAAMQAVGCYQSGRLLFLSLGTGLGSALIADHHVIPLELCELRWTRRSTIEDQLGKASLRRLGRPRWEQLVHTTVAMLRRAFLPDAVVIGGGGSKHLKHLPPDTIRGDNTHALDGGELVWTDSRFRV